MREPPGLLGGRNRGKQVTALGVILQVREMIQSEAGMLALGQAARK